MVLARNFLIVFIGIYWFQLYSMEEQGHCTYLHVFRWSSEKKPTFLWKPEMGEINNGMIKTVSVLTRLSYRCKLPIKNFQITSRIGFHHRICYFLRDHESETVFPNSLWESYGMLEKKETLTNIWGFDHLPEKLLTWIPGEWDRLFFTAVRELDAETKKTILKEISYCYPSVIWSMLFPFALASGSMVGIKLFESYKDAPVSTGIKSLVVASGILLALSKILYDKNRWKWLYHNKELFFALFHNAQLSKCEIKETSNH